MDLSNEEIARRRRENGWTQAELGAMLGISDKAVSKWERGLSKPDNSHLTKLTELFGLPAEEKDNECQPPQILWGIVRSFTSTVRDEILRIIPTAFILTCVYCFLAGYLSAEETVVSIGLSVGFFCFITLIKEK